jgi:hypothetical protein
MKAKKHDWSEECFVVMPIGKGTSDEFYHYFLKPVIEGKGFRPVRADEISSPGSIIIQDIYVHLANSGVVVGDITGQNPNVLYEVGYRHGAGGPVILLVQSVDDVPFDLKGHRIVPYNVSSAKGYHKAKEAIERHLDEIMCESVQGATS